MFGDNLHSFGHLLHTDGVYQNTQHLGTCLERLRKRTRTFILHSLLLDSDQIGSLQC
jgi:hypothetical protein